MIFSGNINRDKAIQYLLKNNAATAAEIKAHIDSCGSIATSGVYKMLNKLIEEGIVVKQGTNYLLSEEWCNQIIAELETTNQPVLQEGERLMYKLNSVSEIDRHWKHYAYQIEKEMASKEIYYYNPHQFWLYLEDRGQSERQYIKHAADKGFKVFHTIGNKTDWDKEFYKAYRSENYRINLGKIAQLKETDNISLFGDYILNTEITHQLHQELYQAYEVSKTEDELVTKINEAAKISPCKLILERNNKKAARLRQLLGKDFA